VPADVCIAAFPTTHAALRAERAAKAAGLAVRMVPVPRSISSDCHVGMEAAVEDMEHLRSILTAEGIDHDLVRWRKG
jgi:alpha-D-ribose 1-methylphosphonate 5-triphosphate diphosphatase PhnM